MENFKDYTNNILEDDNYKLDYTKQREEINKCPICKIKYNTSINSIPMRYICNQGHAWIIKDGKKLIQTSLYG